jgi:hypothetical protein
MNIVTYSLSAADREQSTNHHLQLLYSVESLRAFNDTIPVHIFLYGDHPRGFLVDLEERGASLHLMGSYPEAIRRIRPLAWRALATYPVLHKWFNFLELAPLAPSRILQVDGDTLFFDDVGLLFERYSERHFYAREEPWSRASQYGYNPSYLDEDALYSLAAREGACAIPPYNVGVCLLNHGVWTEIGKRCGALLSYVFRFDAWRRSSPDPRHRQLLEGDLDEEPAASALAFPARNPWIAEQVALWLILGQIPGLTHGLLSREHVLQGREEGSPERRLVHHYFGIDKAKVLSHLGLARQ